MVQIATVVLVLVAVVALAGLGILAYAIVFPRQPYTGPLPPLTRAELALSKRLRRHVEAVASRPHNLAHYAELEAAACHIERELAAMGLTPHLQQYDVHGRPVRNIEVTLEPAPTFAREPTATLVVGAHYDAPDDSPGANDNGTGVAALLELARLLGGSDARERRCRLRLVFFVNEEAPYGKTELMGSLVHARSLSERGERVDGMIALETLGHFSNEPGSQRFPFPFGLVYSDVGNFVAFVGLPRARGFVRKALRAFRAETAFPSIGGVAPGSLEGIDLSDHWAYDQCGYPAMMITDTAPFRNPFYHTRADLPATVDYASLARITLGLSHMLQRLDRE
ncbi:MAG: M28 family peptidase [Hyphomicrobiaceae bacterium]|nr:M28 family peptidase [Hyphomicrobiaceae bacterium]